jgi:hypothetical protein
MGLEQHPTYRTSGRLENYRGDPPLSDNAFRVLQTLVKLAAENVERFHCDYADQRKLPRSDFRLVLALARLTLDEIASSDRLKTLKGTLG